MRFEYQSSWFTMGLRPSSDSKMSGHAVPQCQQRYVLCEKWCLSLFSELDMHMCSFALLGALHQEGRSRIQIYLISVLHRESHVKLLVLASSKMAH